MNQASRRGKQRPDDASVTEDASLTAVSAVTDAASVPEAGRAAGDSPPPDSGAGPSGVGQGEATPQLRRRSKPLRIVMSAAVLFTAWHLCASLLWIAPPSPARDVVPGKLLSQYMIPFFGQSWSVFAPEPINGDHRLFVRAVVATDGTNRTTEWVNATEVETRLMTHKPFPARAASQSINVASSYRDAYGKLNKDQKAAVAKNFSQEGWSASLETELTALAKGDSSARSAYVAADFMAVRYATQVARAIWGEGVVRVQFRVERQNVIPFKQRHDPDAQRPEVQLTPSGWRGIQVAAGQSDQDFADTFRRLYKEVHP